MTKNEKATFKDPALQQGFHELLNAKTMIKQEVTKKKLASFSYLNLSHRDIQWLDGIESCQQLESLFLLGNDIINLEPLTQLPKLRTLDLSMNEWLNFDTLDRPLQAVERLALRSCHLEETNWVRYFPNLKHLSLYDNQLQSIGLITQLDKLQSVDLRANLIPEKEVVAFMNVRAIGLFKQANNQAQNKPNVN